VSYVRAILWAGEPAELSSGSHIHDFLDVMAARMIVDVALEAEKGPANIYSGKPATVREVASFGEPADNRVDQPCVKVIRG